MMYNHVATEKELDSVDSVTHMSGLVLPPIMPSTLRRLKVVPKISVELKQFGPVGFKSHII